MELILLFVSSIAAIGLAFATNGELTSVALKLGRAPQPGGLIGATLTSVGWVLSDACGWRWSPATIRPLMASATGLEVTIVQLLVITWVVMPGFFLGLCWVLLSGEYTGKQKGPRQ